MGRNAVLSAFGCGAFANPAPHVASIYREELEKYAGAFDVVAFGIFHAGYGPNNFAPFERAFAGWGGAAAAPAAEQDSTHRQTPPAREQVVRLAKLAKECGMDGVVCSAREIAPIRAACGADFLLVVPGIRPAGSQVGDQKRVLTPAEAVKAGASSLVVGRPITQAAEPRQAAAAILEEANAAAQ